MSGWEHRARAILALTVLMGSLATSSLCFMDRVAPMGDEHSCCRSGLSAAPPPCCMASAPDEAPAKVAARFELSAPLLTTELSIMGVGLEVGLAGWAVPGRGLPSISPPTRAVLRI